MRITPRYFFILSTATVLFGACDRDAEKITRRQNPPYHNPNPNGGDDANPNNSPGGSPIPSDIPSSALGWDGKSFVGDNDYDVIPTE